ncbi:MAG: hypothetical protein WC364_14330 [Eubacteriales bacterium]|jgi:hypothetical protein
MGNGALYGVAGLASPIEDVFPSFDLPQYSRVTLLPFEGKIIYDSLLYTVYLQCYFWQRLTEGI